MSRTVRFSIASVLALAAALVNASPALAGAVSCDDLFAKSPDQQYAEAELVSLRSSGDYLDYLKAQTYETPKILLIQGPASSGKTYSATHGLVQALRAQGISASINEMAVFWNVFHHTTPDEVEATFEGIRRVFNQFKVLILDDVNLENMKYGVFKELAAFMADRREHGNTTILVTNLNLTEAVRDELDQLVKMATGNTGSFDGVIRVTPGVPTRQ